MPVKKQNRKKKWYQLWYVQLLIIIGIIIGFGVSGYLVYLFCFITPDDDIVTDHNITISKNVNKHGDGVILKSILHINVNKTGDETFEYTHTDNINKYYENTFPKNWKKINDCESGKTIKFYITDEQRDAMTSKFK